MSNNTTKACGQTYRCCPSPPRTSSYSLVTLPPVPNKKGNAVQELKPGIYSITIPRYVAISVNSIKVNDRTVRNIIFTLEKHYRNQ